MSRSVCQNFHDSVSHGTGDASQLSDIVRATLEFKMHPDVLDDMYKAFSISFQRIDFYQSDLLG